MKTNKNIVTVIFVAISFGSIFCSLTSSQDQTTSAAMAALKETETALARAIDQATQLAQGLPTDTNRPPEIASSPSPNNTEGKEMPEYFSCPEGYKISNIFFVTSNIGFVAINPCGIFRTEDGGITWGILSIPTTSEIYSIYFVDPSNGWAAGQDGALIKTTNGGTSWEALTTMAKSNFRIIKFLDNQTGWVAGDNGMILSTTDAGASWNLGATNTQVDIHDFVFSDPKNGIAVGEKGSSVISAYLFTTDGGRIWKVRDMNDPEPEAVAIVGDEIWIVGGWTGGKVWNLHRDQIFVEEWYENQPKKIFEIPAGSGAFRSVVFTDSEHGWTVGGTNEGAIAVFTQDGGDNWTPMLIGNIKNLSSWKMIRFVSNHEAVLAGRSDDYINKKNYARIIILHSDDGGISWQ
jgi:photosystem II stability/assembly factor-like uncharacterized protein